MVMVMVVDSLAPSPARPGLIKTADNLGLQRKKANGQGDGAALPFRGQPLNSGINLCLLCITFTRNCLVTWSDVHKMHHQTATPICRRPSFALPHRSTGRNTSWQERTLNATTKLPNDDAATDGGCPAVPCSSPAQSVCRQPLSGPTCHGRCAAGSCRHRAFCGLRRRCTASLTPRPFVFFNLEFLR